MDAEVVVIGAGFAGMAAARDLRDAGRSAMVLEARDRMGGRTRSAGIPGTGVWAEYGGMFFSRATQPHLAAEIERYGIAVSEPSKETQLAWIRGDERREGSDAIRLMQEKLATSRLPDSLRTTHHAYRGMG